MTILAGQIPSAIEVNNLELPGRVIFRASRSTASTAASGAQGVLRLDGVTVTSGRRYEIRTSTLLIRSSVAADRASVQFSMDTTGAAATTSSTRYAVFNTSNIDDTSNGTGAYLSFNYTAPADQTVSILLWTNRVSGTGNVNLVVAGSSGQTIDIEVVDMGIDPGDTGVDI